MILCSIVAFILGVFCYTIKELQSHKKLKWQKAGRGFWGEDSWKRKWEYGYEESVVMIKRGEAFPLSSTVLVWLTDGYHLMQFFYIKLFILSIILYSPAFTWYWDGAIYLACWYATFNVIYKVFQKKR